MLLPLPLAAARSPRAGAGAVQTHRADRVEYVVQRDAAAVDRIAIAPLAVMPPMPIGIPVSGGPLICERHRHVHSAHTFTALLPLLVAAWECEAAVGAMRAI